MTDTMTKWNHSSKMVSQKRRRTTTVFAAITIRSMIVFLALLSYSSSFSVSSGQKNTRCASSSKDCSEFISLRIHSKLCMSDGWNDGDNDSNKWQTSNDDGISDWEETLARKNDDGFWSTYESSEEEDSSSDSANSSDEDDNGSSDQEFQDDSELWLDTIAAISAEEIEFNQKENERADKVRQMQEWGFDDETIKNTFEIEVDDSLETKDEVAGMKEYREDVYDYEEDEDDWNVVESHTRVDRDSETGESIRQQMVYVDEHTCIGCTNCAMIAQSTFFMEDEHGRARVFNQWGDDDDTIACAIETCPVDCIHYVQYDELVRLETDRRGQNINFKARFVNQGEAGNRVTVGARAYTAPQVISGNTGSRCNNCPSRGCKNCPMFGVGKNPEFEKREQKRKEKIERNRLSKQREEESKSADL